MMPLTRHYRLRPGWALGLAVAATCTALCMSVLAGWQRGGWLAEKLVWVAIGVVLVLSAHLLLALSRPMPQAVRHVGGGLWLLCMMATCYGHATFFLLAQRHAGERRVDAVMLPISPAVSLQGRSLTVVTAEQAHIATALAVANARPCRADCTALRLSRVRLGAQLDALTTEAREVTRQEVGADRQAAHLDDVLASREALRDDPVTARLTTLLGVTAAQIDLLSGLLFAGILEGVACLFWFVALLERDVPVVRVVTPPKRRRAASQPINFVQGDEPPMLLAAGTRDTTVDPGNTDRLAARLRAAGDTVTVKHYRGINHVLLVGALGAPLRGIAPVLDDVADFIDSH